MRKVRCVSPHGGAHHGLRADNEQAAPAGYQGRLILEPNEGGWVWNAVLGHVAVGAEVDAPEPPGFIADGFHFVDATAGAGDACQASGPGCWCGLHRAAAATPEPPPAPPPHGGSSLADLLGKGAE